MRHFFRTIRNIFSIEELRVRILYTLFFLALFRLGSFVVLPGIDPSKLSGEAQGIFGLLDTFLGGAFSNASILGLGIMPYISASIVIQLLTVATPYFQRLQREGESGAGKNHPIYAHTDHCDYFGAVGGVSECSHSFGGDCDARSHAFYFYCDGGFDRRDDFLYVDRGAYYR